MSFKGLTWVTLDTVEAISARVQLPKTKDFNALRETVNNFV